jgi:putative ABC transport system ATP-binding protein
MASGLPILQTRSVSKLYDGGSQVVRAVDEVSISVDPGEFVGLVGPSGSGKTTMLALLAGLLSPTSGQVLIGGIDVGALTENDRARFRRESIGFTFQANNLVPYLTALENVELACRLSGKLLPTQRKRAIELLDRLGLGDRLNSMPSQLSGGQQQRVAIARSLVHNPLIVLADEPTASLDSERGRQVVEAFRSLIKESNRAGVMVTHDLRMVRHTDKVIRMVDGRVADVITDAVGIEMLSGMSERTMTGQPARRISDDRALAVAR